MNIPMPDEIEKSIAIEAILAKGLIRRKSLFRQLNAFYRNIGLRCIFWDTADVMLIAFMCTLMFVFVLTESITQSASFCGILFAISPFLFLLLSLIAEAKERMSGLYELKMTCKYTVRQISAFRMLCFSAAGMAFCGLLSAAPCFWDGYQDFWQMLVISLCALFLCSLLMIAVMNRIHRNWSYYAPSIVWALISILPLKLFGERWELFLLHIPFGIAFGLLCVLVWLYLWEIKKLIFNHEREVISYVNG
jgi:hypothetical protein